MRKEEIEKEIYEKAVTKQNRLLKKVLSLTFGIMGIVFAIITTVVALLPKESTDAIFESNYEKTVFIIIFASFAAVTCEREKYRLSSLSPLYSRPLKNKRSSSTLTL